VQAIHDTRDNQPCMLDNIYIVVNASKTTFYFEWYQ